MAYDAASLHLMTQVSGGQFRLWFYGHADPFATVDNTGYFDDAKNRGLKEGDILIHSETDQDPPIVTMAYCSIINPTTGVGTVASLAVGSSPTVTDLTVTGNASIGDAAADLIGFHGATAVSQRASSNQASTNIASSTDFGATQLAVVQEIMNTLTTKGLWKGAA